MRDGLGLGSGGEHRGATVSEYRISPGGGGNVMQLTLVIFAQSWEHTRNKCIWHVNHVSTKLLAKAPLVSSQGNMVPAYIFSSHICAFM